MNILQGLDVPQTYLVTLNHVSSIRPECMLQQFTYAHPQFSAAAVRAQKRWEEISGVDRIHYCGAYWRNGFHEDGVVSALRVCARFGARLGE
jgi:predicted NAD/FAD-binding protein